MSRNRFATHFANSALLEAAVRSVTDRASAPMLLLGAIEGGAPDSVVGEIAGTFGASASKAAASAEAQRDMLEGVLRRYYASGGETTFYHEFIWRQLLAAVVYHAETGGIEGMPPEVWEMAEGIPRPIVLVRQALGRLLRAMFVYDEFADWIDRTAKHAVAVGEVMMTVVAAMAGRYGDNIDPDAAMAAVDDVYERAMNREFPRLDDPRRMRVLFERLGDTPGAGVLLDIMVAALVAADSAVDGGSDDKAALGAATVLAGVVAGIAGTVGVQVGVEDARAMLAAYRWLEGRFGIVVASMYAGVIPIFPVPADAVDEALRLRWYASAAGLAEELQKLLVYAALRGDESLRALGSDVGELNAWRKAIAMRLGVEDYW